MRVVGLITEYNPFHNGHKFHLEASKHLTNADYVVCVMSGNFIQRGEPALLNKWARTKMALINGVDLVIELPVSYVLQSAEHFAFGAVKILNSLNIVDYICFGSEQGKIEPLNNIAGILANEPEEVSHRIKLLLKEGNSFASAREKAIKEYLKAENKSLNIDTILASPNNILGVEYIKALYKLNSRITPLTIKRHKAGYYSLEPKDEIASATAIRNILQQEMNLEKLESFMPSANYHILCSEVDAGQGPVFSQHFDIAIMTLLRKLSNLQLAAFPDVKEGLQNRIWKAAHTFGTLESTITAVKTKRYTRTRLQRIMFNILLSITKDVLKTFQKYGGPQYIRILGMNKNGKKLLKLANSTASLPIIIKPSSYSRSCNPLLRQMIELDFLATDLYTLHYPAADKRIGRLDYLTSPIIM